MVTLQSLSQSAGAKPATLDHPLEHLVACHDRILQRLDTLERVAGALLTNRDEAIRAADAVVRFFDTNGVWHTQDEEDSLFPRLTAAADVETQRYLYELETQHQEAEQVYKDLKAALSTLTSDAPQLGRFHSLVARLGEIYRQHIASENEHLIGLGKRLLTQQQLAEMAQEMKLRRGLGHE
ncbi:MAG: hemerythrin domain-containing protein [Bryobacterales bacterium]|nr:hemerythrin domain-containing protein [Bryobacterales bacterium]